MSEVPLYMRHLFEVVTFAGLYRGTSLKRKRFSLGPCSRSFFCSPKVVVGRGGVLPNEVQGYLATP